MWMRLRTLFFISLFLCIPLKGMLFDNRHFFIFRQPITRFPCQPFHLTPEIFAMTANSAWDDIGQVTQIPFIEGRYNQVEIAKALVEAGVTPTNLIPPDLRSRSSIFWDINAKLESQGIALRTSYSLHDNFEVGAGIYFMHARQGYEFSLENPEEFTPGQQAQLFSANKAIKEALGVVPAQWDEAGVGDAYFYGRLGNVWDYTLKFRRIDAGISLGIMPPFALGRNPDNPASLPLGGNGRFGVYGEIDAQFELKEDWVAGFDLIGLQRLEKERIERLPFLNSENKFHLKLRDGVLDFLRDLNYAEPINYGVVVAPTSVNPGFTVYFAPYFAIERLRDGFGIRLIYRFIEHQRDGVCTSAEANTFRVEQLSSWRAEFITANLIYDFGYYKECREGSPVLSLAWDAPINFVTPRRSSRTNVISLTLEVAF